MFLRVCRFSLLALIYLPLWVMARGNVQLITTNEVIRLSPQFKVFREAGHPLGILDIKQKLGEFVWPAGDNPHYGFYDKGIWLHTTISNITENK
jgi:two-component system sensor histidine kinase BarA